MAEDAHSYFKEALALDASDNYLLGSYADFLLDHGHFQEVIALLQDKTRSDPLLLRYALALKALRKSFRIKWTNCVTALKPAVCAVTRCT